MKIGKKGIELIKEFEGISLKAYLCPAGVWTIGYGHTKGVKKGDVCTKAQAEEYLKEDIEEFERYVNNLKLLLNQNQFDALVSFSFNLGSGNLKKLVKNRNLVQIADAILLYNKSGGVVLNGLIRRRTAERALFLSSNNNLDEYKVIATALNVRKGPGISFDVIKVLKKNEIVEIIETNGKWGKIANSSSWVSMNYLQKV